MKEAGFMLATYVLQVIISQLRLTRHQASVRFWAEPQPSPTDEQQHQNFAVVSRSSGQ